MIRVTLITGAGKLGRQKYDDNAAKAVTSALRDLGFEEDRGASCIAACAGSFKLQHDTGKNLKTVVVFPRILEEVAGENHHGAPGGSLSRVEEGGMLALLEKGSPREMIALSSKDVFENMVKTRCQTWSQKRGCTAVMSELMTLLQDLEAKLVKGVSLSDLEQSFYDNVSGTALEEKQSFVKDQMHHQVDEGMITSHEKTQLLAQIQERLDHIAKELDDAEKKGQSQKVEKIKKMREKAEARKEKLSNIVPKPNPPLKHHAEIFKLRSELKPLLELEDGARGRLLSLKEAQSLGRKDEILDKIADLEVCCSSVHFVPVAKSIYVLTLFFVRFRKRAADGLRKKIHSRHGWKLAMLPGPLKTRPRKEPKRQERHQQQPPHPEAMLGSQPTK
jgi:hypothetical protein